MSEFKLLFRKELNELFYFFKKLRYKSDFLGIFLSITLSLIVALAVFILFGQLVSVYSKTTLNGITDSHERIKEILTFTYALLIITNTIVGVKKN